MLFACPAAGQPQRHRWQRRNRPIWPAPPGGPGRNFFRRRRFIYTAGSMVDDEDRVLVEAAQRDPARFGDLYERHFERVYTFVVRRVRDRDAAEDVTAEVFHRAL